MADLLHRQRCIAWPAGPIASSTRLVASMPARLLLRHRLRAISHATDRVVAHVEDEQGRAQDIEGDALVMTFPAPALARVEIRPCLPDSQQRAIRALRYGCATKVVVQSPRDLFAGRKARAFGTDTDLGAFWDSTDEGAGRGGRGKGRRRTGGSGHLPRRRMREPPPARQGGCRRVTGARRSVLARHVRRADHGNARGHVGRRSVGRGRLRVSGPGVRLPRGARCCRAEPAGSSSRASTRARTWQGYMNGAVETGLHAARDLLELHL